MREGTCLEIGPKSGHAVTVQHDAPIDGHRVIWLSQGNSRGLQQIVVRRDGVPLLVETLQLYGPEVIGQLAKLNETPEDAFLKRLLGVIGKFHSAPSAGLDELQQVIQARLARGVVERLGDLR
jgi:hypothetical protein